ncbi:DUF1194 domain-containing protein [Arvimicrobium flavum]|uniref:DUF1194 domain-containing protein n=1 Tax=Arvimicrobium flavum TaxID=3393320 RepID=UPI00237B1B5F|nr:DUF1194 domain-containing protein [Mesorhizobium shangrilense]
MRAALALILCLACSPVTPVAAAGDDEVDVELVLAVDASNSMDKEEFALQRAGYVNALLTPEFLNAVQSGRHGRIALTYFEWSGSIRQGSIIPWQIIDGHNSATVFAGKLAALPLGGSSGGTSISSAVAFGASLLAQSKLQGERRIIDISGDGPNNTGGPVAAVRDEAVSGGIIINGLPILIRPSQMTAAMFGTVDRYYSDCVTGGPGSFVLPIHDASEFATAIRLKLILEVSGLAARPRVLAVAALPVDCLVGEHYRLFYPDP